MSDIFVSYARPNEALARQAGEALRAAGYSVWRDDELPAHRAYSDVIEERIKSAKAVLVLWSNDAVRSQWVRAEADAARELGTLVQVSLDGVLPPMPFNQIQCADLMGWRGDGGSAGWQKVVSSIASLAGNSAARLRGRALHFGSSLARMGEPAGNSVTWLRTLSHFQRAFQISWMVVWTPAMVWRTGSGERRASRRVRASSITLALPESGQLPLRS